MTSSLFSVPYYSVEIGDWPARKAELSSMLSDREFERLGQARFETDRHSNGGRYAHRMMNVLAPDLRALMSEMRIADFRIKAAWAVRYGAGDYHDVHNHGSTGFSAVLYLDFDPSEHSPTVFVSPWNDPVSDTTRLAMPDVSEGTIAVVPSSVLHYTKPNLSARRRSIIAFDMEVQ